VHQEAPEQQVQLDQRGLEVPTGHLVQEELQVQLVLQVQLDLRVQQVLQVQRVPPVDQVPQDCKAHLETQVQVVHREPMDRMEYREPQVPRVN